MKTTVEMPDALLRDTKRYAREHDLTLRQVLERSVREFLAKEKAPRKPFRLKDGSFKGGGLLIDYTWPNVSALIYEGRGEPTREDLERGSR